MKECARGYLLSGRPLNEICDHNAIIARKIGKLNVAMLWQFVKLMYGSNVQNKQLQTNDQYRNQQVTQNINRIMLSAQNSMQPIWLDESVDDATIGNSIDPNHHDDEFTKLNEFSITKLNEFKNVLTTQMLNGLTHSTQITNSTAVNSDALNNIVYGDTELTIEHMDFIKSLRNGFLYIGPHDLNKNFAITSDSMMNHDMQQNTRNQTMSRNRRGTSPVI